MEIISLDIAGKFAHFRKYYANNTALSYYIPPRTTLMGMLGAWLGLPRDSYYESLASENIRLGIRVLSPLRKSFHRMNWIMVKGGLDFRGRKGHTQTPFEVVSGQNLRSGEVKYRIYISYYEAGAESFEQIKAALLSGGGHFNLSLGTAQFSAHLTNVRHWQHAQAVAAGEAYVEIHSAVCSDHVRQISPKHLPELQIEEELLPADFWGLPGREREVRQMIRTLYTFDGQPLPVLLDTTHYQLHDATSSERICFLEP